jgi:hypothetical protein
LVLEYYALLRSVLGTKPHLRRCLKRCRHCRIFFLTDPRNAGRKDMREVGRKDLGCPFGCREAHRKQESTRRSVQFYREHKERKQRQNSKRRKAGLEEKEEQAPSGEAVPEPWSEPLVEHVRVVVSLIEGRRVSREEILEMLAKVLRQQGMGRRRKIDHAVAWLNENPP